MRNPATRFKVQGSSNALLTPYPLPLTTSRGFTLIETMVAITILTLAVAGPLFTASRAIVAARAASNQLTASYLAQESVEYIRMMRDNEYISAYADPLTTETASTTGWTNFKNSLSSAGCMIGCAFDPAVPGLSPCLSGTCAPLYLAPTNIYTQQSSGNTPTIFIRTIKVFDNLPGDQPEEKIVSTVTWSFHNVSYTVATTDHLTPWQSP
jgi:prepilin-type N-terminal cleavage/methylation domain-containing protein